MAGEDSDTSIKLYLREIMRVPLLTPQEEIELAARIKKGDSEARAWMIKANLRLVVKIAHDYANLGLPLLDLISEGNIGLMRAVERFDPAKGGKLSTYGAWWIKQSIKRALANQSKTIRLPVHLIDKIYKLNRASLQMSEELGREPTDEELAEEIGISSAKLSKLKTVSIRPASLDAPISDDDSTAFGEIVGDEEAQTPFELFRDKNLRDELIEILEVLDDRERKIIFQRFGLDGGGPKTLEEIGKKFAVTRERIRQLQNIALAKLRRALSKKETPIVRRDPIQFLKPVSPDPTRTSVANATTSPKATLHLASSTRFLEIIPCVPYGVGGVVRGYHAPAQSAPGKKTWSV
jgi:RNA polymerase primary sigma factor